MTLATDISAPATILRRICRHGSPILNILITAPLSLDKALERLPLMKWPITTLCRQLDNYRGIRARFATDDGRYFDMALARYRYRQSKP